MTNGSWMSRLERNLREILNRMARAAERSGRSPESVRLIAVTKYVSEDAARYLVRLGQRDLGESRPQQFWTRAEALADAAVAWHFIGPLQKNKVRKTLKHVAWIHSVESWELLAAIERMAAEEGKRPTVLLEVNVSGNPAKHGFSPDGLLAEAEKLSQFRSVEIRGLMCMAGWEGDAAGARRDFQTLRSLQEQLRAAAPKECLFDQLSMGMSGDFEIAIEEGATMVRVGSALFEGIEGDLS